MRKSLLVLTSTFPRGVDDTTPPFVFELSRRLTEDFHVTVLTPAVPGAEDEQAFDGVRVRRFHYFWPRSAEILADGAILDNVRRRPLLLFQAPLMILFGCIATYRLARTERPSVIHAHWLIPQGLIAVLVGRLLKIPVVATAHGADVYGLRGIVWEMLRRFVVSRCESVTVVSRDLAERLGQLRSRNGRGAEVLPMGVETSRFSANGSRNAAANGRVLFVGRLARKKGVEFLIRALPEILKTYPATSLVIVGDGPCRAELESLAKELDLAERVEFVGGRAPRELPSFYRQSTLLVAPSVVTTSGDTEAFGLVFAEAMAAGIPAIGTRVGGTADVVVDGRTGLLVEPGSPTAIAAAVTYLLSHPLRARRMGAVAQRWVRAKFDWARVAERYMRVLSQAAGDRPV